MPKEFSENGVQFLYPDNWRLDKHPSAEGLDAALTLEAPSGAMWTLNVEGGLRSLEDLADSVRQTLCEEYEDVEYEPHTGCWGELETSGYELHFYVMELVVKAVIECLHFDGRTYMVMTQAEIRDYDELAPIFQALATSLVSD